MAVFATYQPKKKMFQRVRINNAPATPASVWTTHRLYWPHRPYTVYIAVLYAKQGAVKLSKMWDTCWFRVLIENNGAVHFSAYPEPYNRAFWLNLGTTYFNAYAELYKHARSLLIRFTQYSTQLKSVSNYGPRWLTPQCQHVSSQYYITDYNTLISWTDLSPIFVRSAVKTYLTTLCIQNLSRHALNRHTVSTVFPWIEAPGLY